MSDLNPQQENERIHLRNEIDRIDSAILGLLDERLRTSVKLADIKTQHGLPIYDPARETAHMHDLLQQFTQQECGDFFPRIDQRSAFFRLYQPVLRSLMAASYGAQGGLNIVVVDAAPEWHTLLFARSHFGTQAEFRYKALGNHTIDLSNAHIVVLHPAAVLECREILTVFEFAGVIIEKLVRPGAYIFARPSSAPPAPPVPNAPNVPNVDAEHWELGVARRLDYRGDDAAIVNVGRNELLLFRPVRTTDEDDKSVTWRCRFGSILRHW